MPARLDVDAESEAVVVFRAGVLPEPPAVFGGDGHSFGKLVAGSFGQDEGVIFIGKTIHQVGVNDRRSDLERKIICELSANDDLVGIRQAVARALVLVEAVNFFVGHAGWCNTCR